MSLLPIKESFKAQSTASVCFLCCCDHWHSSLSVYYSEHQCLVQKKLHLGTRARGLLAALSISYLMMGLRIINRISHRQETPWSVDLDHNIIFDALWGQDERGLEPNQPNQVVFVLYPTQPLLDGVPVLEFYEGFSSSWVGNSYALVCQSNPFSFVLVVLDFFILQFVLNLQEFGVAYSVLWPSFYFYPKNIVHNTANGCVY